MLLFFASFYKELLSIHPETAVVVASVMCSSLCSLCSDRSCDELISLLTYV
jgi:hypothetical protein